MYFLRRMDLGAGCIDTMAITDTQGYKIERNHQQNYFLTASCVATSFYVIMMRVA